MPTYDYICKTCGHRFEHFQSISAEPLQHCPVEECAAEDQKVKGKGEVVRKVSGGAGLVFKGSGFYLTDYVRSGETSSSESKPSTKEESKTEKSSKPASTGSDSATSKSDSSSSAKE